MNPSDEEYKQEDEEYVRLRESIQCLNISWAILKALEEPNPNKLIHAAAFRMALIEYTKPYTQSRGFFERPNRLPFPLVGEAENKLHEILMNLRHQFLAHADITIKVPITHKKDHDPRFPPAITINTDPVLPSRIEVIQLIEKSLEIHCSNLESIERSWNKSP